MVANSEEPSGLQLKPERSPGATRRAQALYPSPTLHVQRGTSTTNTRATLDRHDTPVTQRCHSTGQQARLTLAH